MARIQCPVPSSKVWSFSGELCHQPTSHRSCSTRRRQTSLFECIHRTIFLHLAIILIHQSGSLLAFQATLQAHQQIENKANYDSPSESVQNEVQPNLHNHGHHHQLLHPRRAQFNPQAAYKEHSDVQWMMNVTASIGRNATFECRFPDLRKDFKLAWFHRERHTLLALQNSVIFKNGRISVRSHANTTFYLTIHDIRESDRGIYMCQVNTIPMRKQLAYLEVSVPPTFVEKDTSSDVDVKEGSPVSLSCVAKGRPEPEITWRREDNEAIVLEYPLQTEEDKKQHHSQRTNKARHNNKTTRLATMKSVKGNQLNITVSHRTQTGAFLCIASNGIPSPIAKRIFLGVIFTPIVKSRKESVGVYIGNSVTIDCHIEAYPQPSVYWQKDDRMPPIIHSDRQYEIDLLDDNVPYRFILRLKILNFTKDDVGKYTCVGKNIAGEDNASLRLYKLERPTPKATIQKAKSLFLDLFASSNQETTTVKPIRTEMTTLRPPGMGEKASAVSTTKPKDRFSELEDQYGSLDEEDDDEDSDLDYGNQYISPGRERIHRIRNRNRAQLNSASSIPQRFSLSQVISVNVFLLFFCSRLFSQYSV